MVAARRKAFLAIGAFAVFVLYFSHQPRNWRVPSPSAPASPIGASTPSDDDQTKLDPASKHPKFSWSTVTQHYPLSSFAALPEIKPGTDIPRIQHDFNPDDETSEARDKRLRRVAAVREEFKHAWRGYKKKAWLSDEVTPLTGGTLNTFGGWAATLVDSLDTLWIMGLHQEFEDSLKDIELIDFSTCSLDELNVFETTIRYLGGFLAAYDVSDGKFPSLLEKAKEMGEMLYKAFDTPNRMPLTRWKFKDAAEGAKQEADDTVLLAEIGSLTLEFTRLSQVTGDSKYYDAIARITNLFEEQQNQTKLPGMWPVVVNAKTLDFKSYNGFTIGGMADSMYEYLPKQHLLLGGATPQYEKLYSNSVSPIKKYMLYRPMVPKNESILMVGDVSPDGKLPPKKVWLEPKNQHLTCFAGGMFAVGGKIFKSEEDVDVGWNLTQGCLWAYDNNANGIMPEIMYTVPCDSKEKCGWDYETWRDAIEKAYAPDVEKTGKTHHSAEELFEKHHLREGIAKIADPRYILRPEAIESVFVLYRVTGHDTLQDRGWDMFDRIVKVTRTPIAHAALDDVTTPKVEKADRMESFWLAETLKYFYLLFSEPNVISLDEYVLNTEAHPLKRPSPPKGD
ncbi:glycosyl hydrolase family 47-domain-containing protein [Phyllosticta citriasiana]|uniref:glycosyl hydrolase family 47-domain-containing protein n=1 Tax=Phyllosticta citriasiana TaxID=595635 RepID=UPI0030FD3B7B